MTAQLGLHPTPTLTSYARRAARKTRFTHATSKLRELPDYLIIGVQRGGTSSLHTYLVQHPAVARAYLKEIHYFDRNFHRGVDWYRSFFPTRTYMDYLRRKTGSRVVCGDATPGYFFNPHTPFRVAELLPDVKLILLLRNPIDRAYSNYCHRVAQGLEHLDTFESAIESETARIEGEREKMLEDPTYVSEEYRLHSYLARGIYADQLETWFKLFPPESFLIERSEDLFADPATVVNRVFRFLGVPEFKLPQYPTYNALRSGKISPETRARLVDYFRPHNERLYALVGRDFAWDR